MNSPNARLLFVLLLGGLLGGAITKLLSSRPESPPATPLELTLDETDSVDPSPGEAGELPVVRGALEAPSVSAPDSASGPDLQPEDTESTRREAQPATRREDPELARGSITGVVRDPEGQPLAGAVVQLTASQSPWNSIVPSTLGRGAPPLPTLEEELDKARERFAKAAGSTLRTTTDERGRYRFDDLLDQPWRPTGYLEGYLFETPSATNIATIGTSFDLTAAPALELPIEVVDEQGTRVLDAHIQCVQELSLPRRTNFRLSEGEQSLRLAPGVYEITAYGPNSTNAKEAKLASEPRTIELIQGLVPETVRLLLRRPLGISGRVTLAPGYKQSQLSYVCLLPLEPGLEPDLKLLAQSQTRVFASPGSRYHFPDLDPGHYLIGLKRSYNAPISSHATVQLLEESLVQDFELGAVDESNYLRMSVTGPGGPGLSRGLHFSLLPRGSNLPRHSRLEKIQRGPGDFLLGLDEEVARVYFDPTRVDATYFLQVRHRELGTRELMLTPGQKEASIHYEEPGTLVVQVRGYTHSEYEGRLRVVAAAEGEDLNLANARSREWVDSAGKQTLKTLVPGNYTIALKCLPRHAPEHSWYSAKTISTIEARVDSGINRAHLNLPDLHSLHVHWKEAQPGDRARLTRSAHGAQPDLRSAYFAEDARAEFEFLEPGEYRLSVGEPGSAAPRTITIPSDPIVLESE